MQTLYVLISIFLEINRFSLVTIYICSTKNKYKHKHMKIVGIKIFARHVLGNSIKPLKACFN